jgi:hypothetical protein
MNIDMLDVEDEQNQALQTRIAELAAQVERLSTQQPAVKKNHKTGKVNATRKYTLLSKKMESWGRVPQQQADIAEILSKHMDLGKEYSEQYVFDLMIDQGGDYKSITSSIQDPTYLFRYYRGLKNDGKHAGFVARNFLKQIG